MAFPHSIVARFHEHIEPLDRGSRYEDPLQEVLNRDGIGEVAGGGSQLNANGGIEYAEIEVDVANLDAALITVIEALEKAGAPQGSEILAAADGKLIREFGKQQCLAVFLDGVSLPDEVYASLDFEAVVAEIGAAAGDDSFRGFWQGPQETGLFFFGQDADSMFARVEPVLRKLPIGQNARVVVRHGNASLKPREVRMPRH